MTAESKIGQAVSRLPKSVVIVDNGTYQSMEQDPKLMGLLEDPVALVLNEIADRDSTLAARARSILAESGDLNAGALMVLNPYRADTYVPAHEAVEEFASSKFQMLAKVASHLGARKVTLKSTEVHVERSTINAKIGAKVKVIGASITGKRKLEQRIKSTIQAEWEFIRSAPDVDKARNYLSNMKVRDSDLESLIELREDGKLRKRTIKLNATRESARNLEAALKLANSGRIKLQGADAQFGMGGASQLQVDLITEVVF